MSSEVDGRVIEPEAAVPPATTKLCANCGAPLYGPYCYACGQTERGMIRHLASVLSDAADTIFNVDSRIFHSILPLYLRPGFLTNEYFAGRRTRYVTPFRLFFFLCVIAFFAIQIYIGGTNFALVGAGRTAGIEDARSEAEVQQRMQQALDGIATARSATGLSASATRKLDKAEADVRRAAERRRAKLAAARDASADGAPSPAADDDADADTDTLKFDDIPWNPFAHPIAIGWLPAFANAKLNEMAVHAKENVDAAKKDPRHFVAGVFSVLPQTLFVLMPLFAVLLKVVYLFKRRLYMEHLMVALHSHAFIFLSLLLLVVVDMLRDWASADLPALRPLLSLVHSAIWIWLPVYLFLMQKRVYRQGWIMTTLKYAVVGFCYVIILSFGVAGAAIASLAIT